jgi:hypothetical protein
MGYLSMKTTLIGLCLVIVTIAALIYIWNTGLGLGLEQFVYQQRVSSVCDQTYIQCLSEVVQTDSLKRDAQGAYLL